MSDKYFGLYCPQHNLWLMRANGDPVMYPAAEVADAMLKSDSNIVTLRGHLWEVTEFGKQERVSRDNLPTDAEVCPVPDWRLSGGAA